MKRIGYVICLIIVSVYASMLIYGAPILMDLVHLLIVSKDRRMAGFAILTWVYAAYGLYRISRDLVNEILQAS